MTCPHLFRLLASLILHRPLAWQPAWISASALPLALLALAPGLFVGSVAKATVEVRYSVEDIPETLPGPDFWRYSYELDGFDYGADHGFSILFDPDDFVLLSLNGVTPAPSVWDVIVLQPDRQLPAFGLYDALALDTPGDANGPFEVTFLWLGQGEPGAQDFVVYDPSFATLESGRTRLPEPSTTALVALGLALLGLRGRETTTHTLAQQPQH